MFKGWATIFIENGISNPKEIMNRLNKPWSCSANGGMVKPGVASAAFFLLLSYRKKVNARRNIPTVC
ncbi:hypothetical protein [Bacillus sp. X1(2014)]|uniref:hypothetical protein n=1 Tax=Bacillus sp. X1(2014) TaxID=1565991 RepID=UPI00164353BB|nr:hypothetical protein [Bacillus sp. X1(2014)]